ncbi:hypothetical protein FAI40_02560 [Acetobacteraceae bacterium]|nr:hypothetical protein FAI40_02560 [Acetobacteraceae bacterium]
MKPLFFAIVALFYTSSTAFADICEGVALSNFSDEAGHHVQKGEIISSLHSDKFDHKGNPKTYAQYMGFVWSAKKVKLTNCHIEKGVKNGKIVSKLVLNNTPDNQNEIKYQKARKFLETETTLCMAETGNAASAYVYNPASKLGRLTAGFIEGRSKNKNFPEPKWPEGAISGKDD